MAIRTEIFINKQKLDLTQDIPFVLNYQISDIRNPEQRKTDTSYTVQVQGTKNNNKIFSHIFEISKEILSSDLSVNYTPDFNPNLRTDAVIYVDGLPIFNGYCKLEEVVNVKGNITYNLSFKGQLGSIFNSIKNLKLTDLDLASNVIKQLRTPSGTITNVNHNNNTVDASNVVNINKIQHWRDCVSAIDASVRDNINYVVSGYSYYCFPLIDKGNEIESEFELNKVYPAWSLSSYINGIFEKAGYSYKSKFLKSAFFNSFLIPYLDTYNLPLSEITNRTAYVASTATTYTTNLVDYDDRQGTTYTQIGSVGTKANKRTLFNPNDKNLPYSDVSNLVNTQTDLITINKQGYYSFDYNINVSLPTTFTINGVNCYFELYQNLSGINLFLKKFVRYNNNTPQGTVVMQSGGSFFNGLNQSVNLNATNIRCESGEQYFFEIDVQVTGQIRRVDNNAIVRQTNNANYTYTIQTSTLKLESVSNLLFSGDTYVLNSFIPKDVSCTDLLLSTFKLFNLQVDIDKEDKTGKTLVIEPFQDFYTNNTILDWNKKLDTSKPVSFKPISEIDAKTYTFTYSQDDDYYNQAYTRIYGGEVYGQKQVEVQNDFVTQNKKVEVIFSPLLPVKFATTNLIAPRCYDADENGNITQRDKNNIRLLYTSNNILVRSNFSLKLQAQNGTINRIMYSTLLPFYGHTDNPTRPNVDILFGTPRQVFWSGIQAYTNFNLYNRFYKSYIDNITSKDSKLLKCYIYLTPLDIYNFSFRNYVQVMGQNFRVNRISNYNPLSNTSTEVELFKLTNETGFQPSEIQLENESVNPSDVYYIIDAGVDTVRSPLATSPYNLINCGLDEVRGFGSMSSINLIDGGEDTI